jgi:hypothetical protein
MAAAFESLPKKVSPNAAPGIHPKYTQKARELAFLGVVSAWEYFVEQTLVRYIMGASSGSGYAPVLAVNRALSILEAYKELSQDHRFHPNSKYLKASDPLWVRDQANRLFTTHSYQCIQGNLNLLKKCVLIRNRIAHKSKKSWTDFETASHWFLNPPGMLVQGFSPGALLKAPVQRHFGASVSQAGKSHFEAYLDLFGNLADQIAPP